MPTSCREEAELFLSYVFDIKMMGGKGVNRRPFVTTVSVLKENEGLFLYFFFVKRIINSIIFASGLMNRCKRCKNCKKHRSQAQLKGRIKKKDCRWRSTQVKLQLIPSLGFFAGAVTTSLSETR